MLPKPNRLPSPDIRIVLRRGRRVSNDYIQLVFLPNQVQTTRFAFVVSTGLDKRATARNRVKRLLREAVRKALPQIQKGVDAVLIARSKQLMANEKIIADRVDALLRRAQMLP